MTKHELKEAVERLESDLSFAEETAKKHGGTVYRSMFSVSAIRTILAALPQGDELDRLREALGESSRNELLRRMEEISEDHYCAGWMSGLEFDLWNAAHATEDYRYGMGVIDTAQREALRKLSQDAGGWWRWSKTAGGPEFLKTADWIVARAALSPSDQSDRREG